MPEPSVSAPRSSPVPGPGAVGALTSAGAGVGAAAPAYGLAAGLGWAAAGSGPRALLLAVLALVPVLACACAQRELSRAYPDPGTSYAWVSRAFGPRAGWLLGGWPRIAADLLVLAVQARVAGQYLLAAAGAGWLAQNLISPLVVAAGLAVIAGAGWLAGRGGALTARVLAASGGFSVLVLLVLAAAALARAAGGHAAAAPSWSWLDPAGFAGPGPFAGGLALMVFAYWGWDTAFALERETAGRARGVASVAVLGGAAAVTVLAAQIAAGTGASGAGLSNPAHAGDVLVPLGAAVFGPGPAGAAAARLLAASVLASVAAGAVARVVTASRTLAAMAAAGALPSFLGRPGRRPGVPSAAAGWFAAAGAVLLAALSYVDGGTVLSDAAASAGFFIAVYLAATGFACCWVFRRTLASGARNLWLRGIVPLACGVLMTGAGAWCAWFYAPAEESYSVWRLPPGPWPVGGVPGTALVTAVAGLLAGLPWILRIRDTGNIDIDTRMLPTPHLLLPHWPQGRSRNPFSLTKALTSVKVRTSPPPLCHS